MSEMTARIAEPKAPPLTLDPTQAEAFVRGRITELAEEIARLTNAAAEKINKFRADYPERYEVQHDFNRGVMERLYYETRGLNADREAMIAAIVRLESLKPPKPIIVQNGRTIFGTL